MLSVKLNWIVEKSGSVFAMEGLQKKWNTFSEWEMYRGSNKWFAILQYSVLFDVQRLN